MDTTRYTFPASPLDELFRAVVQRLPDAVAIREGAAELTYTQLAAAAAEQARRLLASGVQPGDTVLIGMRRSIAEVVAVLGTVWAGAAYVGVDLDAPNAHLTAITKKCKPAAAVLGPEAAAPALREIPQVDAWQPTWPEDGPDPAILGDADPEALAYVAFTSGSTGAPKGVCVPHRAVSRLALGADYVQLGPGDRMLRLSPLAFDASTFEIWGSLLAGATLEVYPGLLPSPSDLGSFLVEREVTVAWFTAGFFRLLVDFALDALGGLRHLLTGGDVVPHQHVARLLTRHPGVTITNGYGPTENTTFTTTYSVTRPEDAAGPLPIGTPVLGTRIHVLDTQRRPVPRGEVGELYVAGEGLALGYLGDAVETEHRFGHFSPEVPERLYRTGDLVRMDADGHLHFLGRTDDQIKLRGYRVEPDAISRALTSCPAVEEAVVFVSGTDSANKRLVAAIVRAPEAEPNINELRTKLAETLPPYMVPTLWAVVDTLPLTPNGKVDRKKLADAAVIVV
jgi:amino acid adenylation domain-containing protein